MRSRYLSLAAIVIVLVAVFLFWNGPHSARGSGQNVVVLCSSCVYDKAGDGFGNPKVGIFLLDTDHGDIWVYPDSAMQGKTNPIHWGKLVLGQPVARTDH